MANKNNYNELSKKRFEALNEAAIDLTSTEKLNLPLVKALVESFNQKYKTNFWLDERRNEIVNASLIKEHYSNFVKLRELLERKGCVDLAICESVVSHSSNLQRLLESELEQAEIVLAAQSLGDRLQKMVEDLAGMMAEDVLPIADQMKMTFGTEYAEKWQTVVRGSLEEGFEELSEIRNKISNANLVLEKALEGDMQPASDMSGFEEEPSEPSEPSEPDLGDAADDDIDDLLGGDDAASGPEDEPLGRAKKESISFKGKKLIENEEMLDTPVVERNAFVDALNKAVDADKDEFTMDGKKFRITDKAKKTFEEVIHEHEDFMNYVKPWRDRGFSIYVSRPHEGALMFEIERDGVEKTVYEPGEGVYEIVGKPGVTFDSLDSAIRHAYVLDDVEEALEALEEDADMQIGIKKGEMVRLSNFRVKNPKNKVMDIKGDKAIIARNGNEDDLITIPLSRIKNVKKRALELTQNNVKEDTSALADKTVDALAAGAKATSQSKDPKKEKAQRDLDLAMKRNPTLASTLAGLVSEAFSTIEEDISLGINESKAIKNASMLHDISETELKKAWLSK